MFPLVKQGKDFVPTVAPGQYPYTGVSSSYTVSGLSGKIYVIAHAIVCGNF